MAAQLAQIGSAYVPTSLLADTSRGRVFTGVLDPHSVTGVVLAVNDVWESLGAPPDPSPGIYLDTYGDVY